MTCRWPYQWVSLSWIKSRTGPINKLARAGGQEEYMYISHWLCENYSLQFAQQGHVLSFLIPLWTLLFSAKFPPLIFSSIFFFSFSILKCCVFLDVGSPYFGRKLGPIMFTFHSRKTKSKISFYKMGFNQIYDLYLGLNTILVPVLLALIHFDFGAFKMSFLVPILWALVHFSLSLRCSFWFLTFKKWSV